MRSQVNLNICSHNVHFPNSIEENRKYTIKELYVITQDLYVLTESVYLHLVYIYIFSNFIVYIYL